MVSLPFHPPSVTASLRLHNPSNCLLDLSVELYRELWAVWDLIVRANLASLRDYLKDHLSTTATCEEATAPPTDVSRPETLSSSSLNEPALAKVATPEEPTVTKPNIDLPTAPVKASDFTLASPEVVDDEDLVPSPPPSPTLSSDSFLSAPLSPSLSSA